MASATRCLRTALAGCAVALSALSSGAVGAGIRTDFVPTLSAAPGSRVRIPLDSIVQGNPGSFVDRGTTLTATSYDSNHRMISIDLSTHAEGVVAVPIQFSHTSFTVVLRSEAKPSHDFEYQTTSPVKQVSVAGSFNGWNTQADILTGPDASGIYHLTRTLEPGTHQYKIVVDGKWITDPRNPRRDPDGYQGFNSILDTSGSAAAPTPRLVRVSARSRDQLDAIEDLHVRADKAPHYIELAIDAVPTTAALDPRSVLVMVDNEVFRPPHGVLRAEFAEAFDADNPAAPEHLAFLIPKLAPGRHRVRVNARTADGRWVREASFWINEGPAKNLPTDWSDQVIYFAMTDRFSNGNRKNDAPVKDERLDPRANHMGGDWAGIMRKIRDGYFRRLGVTTLWISPPNMNAEGIWRDSAPPNRYYSSYHGYWPVSPRETNPRFGTPGELKALVVTANRAGIKVIADFVANHVHQDHPYYREHRDWFGVYRLPDGSENLRKFDEHPLTTWFDTFLPDFDYGAHPDAVDAMTQDAVWWAKEFGLDGFRHDATKHVSSDFWTSLTIALKTEVEPERGEQFLQIGESIVGRQKLMEYVGPGMLTGQFDFPLYWDIRACLASETAGLDQLDRSVHDSLRTYGPWAVNPVFVGNHDFPRFMTFADGWLKPDEEEKEFGWSHDVKVRDPLNYEKLKSAFTLIFTLPQVPMIYFGDEIGMAGAGDPDNRRMMRFGRSVTRPERGVLDRVERLASLEGRTHHCARAT